MTVRPGWRSTVRFCDSGPGMTLLHESSELKVVLVARKPGRGLPTHPGPAASFHFLDGEGVMAVESEEIAVSSGATVVLPSISRASASA